MDSRSTVLERSRNFVTAWTWASKQKCKHVRSANDDIPHCRTNQTAQASVAGIAWTKKPISSSCIFLSLLPSLLLSSFSLSVSLSLSLLFFFSSSLSSLFPGVLLSLLLFSSLLFPFSSLVSLSSSPSFSFFLSFSLSLSLSLSISLSVSLALSPSSSCSPLSSSPVTRRLSHSLFLFHSDCSRCARSLRFRLFVHPSKIAVCIVCISHFIFA